MAQGKTAEEMAAQQRNISVAEFFERNRHLLGFDNKRKALLTTIKEACDNSLTHDMPMLIREDGKIRIVKIGEFINKKIETKKNNVTSMRDGQLERLSLHEFIETLSFDKKTQKLGFHRVSTLFRHKVNSKIYRVKLTSGRYVDFTTYHSFFSFNFSIETTSKIRRFTHL